MKIKRSRQTQTPRLEDMVDRYNRQELIEGWNQEKIQNAKVAIVGTGITANYVSVALAALGFGTIEIYGNGLVSVDVLKNHRKNSYAPDYSSGFSYFDSVVGVPKAEALAGFIKQINPLIESWGVNVDLCRPGSIRIMGKPDLILETTNDPASKFAVIEYASSKKIPVLSMSADETSSGIGFFDSSPRRRDAKRLIENIVFAEYNGKKQGSTPSQVVSAVAAEEARKYIMPIRNEPVIDDVILYSLASDKRFDGCRNRTMQGEDNFSEKTVLMVGAGALGNFAGLDFVLNNIGHLIIVDFDTVESTNLNRQVFFYDSVGRNKAAALAEKLRLINPRVKFTCIQEKILPESEKLFKNTKIDLMADTVDNDRTRALLNYFSLKYRIPYIHGSTSFNGGHVNVSIPGVTACLNCQQSIDKYALNTHTEGQSCIYAPQASVITSNQLVGALMVGESKTLFQPGKYGQPIHVELKYASGEKFRLGTLPTQEMCNCFNDDEMLGSWLQKMKHLYK